MSYRVVILGLLLAAWTLVGCAADAKSDHNGRLSQAMIDRNQGYGLLYSLVQDESQLDKAMLLKSPPAEFAALIKAIAHDSDQAAQKLKSYAQQDPMLKLDATGLPAIEVRTRDSISKFTAGQLLFDGGKSFEVNLLLTQTEALKYMSHLAGQLASVEQDPARKTYLDELSKHATNLYKHVLEMLKKDYMGMAS